MTDHTSGSRHESVVTAGPGGAMTDDVGVITGELTIATSDNGNNTADIDIQYTGADEWYTLTGSPAPIPPDGLAALHATIVATIRAGDAAQAPR